MNYIKQLQAENNALKHMVRELVEGVQSIHDYAASEKFAGRDGFKEGHINRNDIILRSNEVLEAHISREYELQTFPVVECLPLTQLQPIAKYPEANIK